MRGFQLQVQITKVVVEQDRPPNIPAPESEWDHEYRIKLRLKQDLQQALEDMFASTEWYEMYDKGEFPLITTLTYF